MSLTASLKAGHSTGKPDLLIFFSRPCRDLCFFRVTRHLNSAARSAPRRSAYRAIFNRRYRGLCNNAFQLGPRNLS
jgi:hypothetical protein